MSFTDSTKAFFDELSKIEAEKLKAKEDGEDRVTDRPFSSLLTQDEEPKDSGYPNTFDHDEPEVVTRATA